ncbi:MAG: hypothetical protein RIC55_15100 [Pirellulaceae bacterium]
MAFQKIYDESLPILTPPCIHLRSKAMYVTGKMRDTEHPDEAGSQHCWCNLTQHVVGPDSGSVDRPACIPGRDCYRETY